MTDSYDPEEPLELGEPDKIILLGGSRQGGKIAQTINEAYERGRADMKKELLGDGKSDGWIVEDKNGEIRTLDDSSDYMVTDKKTAELYAKSYDEKAYPVKLVKVGMIGDD